MGMALWPGVEPVQPCSKRDPQGACSPGLATPLQTPHVGWEREVSLGKQAGNRGSFYLVICFIYQFSQHVFSAYIYIGFYTHC